MPDHKDARHTILVGEDDAEVRNYLGLTLRCLGYDPQLMVDGEEVLNYLQSGGPASLILLDIMMPNKDGWETLTAIQKMGIGVPVIMLSGISTPPNVVEAIKSGAANFLAKPLSHMDLCRVIEQALQGGGGDGRSGNKNPECLRAIGSQMYVGKSVAMKSVVAELPVVAASDVSILIQGETGTGKEVLARKIHELSSRASRRFVKLNCAAIPSELIESELFGHERGAYTGAAQRKLGLFELADQGTIFLDEIGDMEIRLQAKLLQVLQDHEFRRVGGVDNIAVQVRVIAATNRDLAESIRLGTFREDLYYRLNIFTMSLPALRDRAEDIVEMAELLMWKHAVGDVKPPRITPALAAALTEYHWPGNVRQLENVARKLLVIQDPQRIAVELRNQSMIQSSGIAESSGAHNAIAAAPRAMTRPIALAEVRKEQDEAEVRAILGALHQTNWNRKLAAALLNIEYKALLYKMKKLGIEDRASKISLLA